MTLEQIADVVGGTVVDGDPRSQVTAAAIFDSRAVAFGSLFVALPGARTDGHHFAAAAVAGGAAAALTTRPVGVPAVIVTDVRQALGRLAAAIVDRHPHLDVVGVTGSAGKTTTKDLLGQVLARLGPTVAPAGNRNNEIGLPQTITQLTPESRFLVAEMGARHRGDIAYLCSLAHPQVGVVLNVGTAHLGEFGSREAIAAAKGELVEALPSGGRAVLNAEDSLVAGMLNRTTAQVVTFGRTARADVAAERVELDDLGRPLFQLHTPHGSAPVHLQLRGEHFVPNALAAAAATLHYTSDIAAVAAGLSAAVPVSAGRMRVTDRPDGVTVVDDSYNASPPAMAGALQAVHKIAGGRRIVAVLGEMFELGDAATGEHMTVGELAADCGAAVVIAVGGPHAALISDAARDRGVAALHLPDANAALHVAQQALRPGDVVLVKGSNGVGLQPVATAIAAAGRLS
ncbi:UDP-N-acetylmuramoyl-tripeptide--D-alanyl-D-alanine ligase [Actinoplanes sp. NPDC020271]|uniref:UDP-N-acetylmuramoyl-tripeptide--D-alanyl-D- alanine ligase n=1 Tax=Actinoplanes sp. NPDC020271 TaxID=3363896 RepID=UPI0037BC322E